MNTNLFEINIGEYIVARVDELNMPMDRICNFFKKDETEILKMYNSSSIHADLLLRWSKLLQYDFFRIYSQHLILYSPPSAVNKGLNKKNMKSNVPIFRKNIYTKIVIDYILSLIENKKKTKIEIMNEYQIPRSTLYKWIKKYKKYN